MITPRIVRFANAIVGALLIASGLPAQTLARPGWVGSGLTAEAWFKRSIFYEIDTRTFQDSNGDGTGDLKGITERLGYIQSLGVDAILLDSLTPPKTGASAASAGAAPGALDPALGTLDDFDGLTLEASRLKIRILIELSAPDSGLARFWLTRGVAGFYLPAGAAVNATGVQAIRTLLPSYVGQRVLITDAGPAGSSASKLGVNELVLDRVDLAAPISGASGTDSVAALRTALDQSQAMRRTGTPIFAIGGAGISDNRLARVALSAILLNRSASLITAGQELGVSSPPGKGVPMPWGKAPPTAAVEEDPEVAKPIAPVVAAPDKYTPFVPYVRPVAPRKAVPPDPASAAGQETDRGSLLSFYRQLSLLHHGGTAIHDGEEIVLDHDREDALIWIRKPASPSPTNPVVVIACNLSDKAVVLSLRTEMTRLQLRGTFLRTLVRSDDAMGGTSIDPLTVPAYGVYVGELRR